jgi:uncharacterized membrane protein
MRSDRLETFSDGVLAILITIMVLELKVPHGEDLGALQDLLPKLLSYVLSFVILGIYWNNHHHMLRATERVNGTVLWANLHLLFWLSLFPVSTAWMGETHAAPTPTAVYGAVLLAAAVAYYVLQATIIRAEGPSSPLKEAIGSDIKGKMSPVLYAAGVGTAFVATWLSLGFYVLVALIWLVPDRRLESRLLASEG